MTEPSPDLPSPGDMIAGKYQVESILGKGGMGVVVAARHLALRQRVAVKFLLPGASRLPDASARFLREARAAVAIRSEHVARVLDVGELESGAPYIVMEHLEGVDLGRMIKQRGPVPYEDAVDLVLQAIEAIAEAHSLGIIHRDLKPANLFVTSRSEGSPLVKVLDFGLSKMALQDTDVAEGSLTTAGVVAGSPHYMSPEQIRSLKHVDERTDIWALGVILYEVLTGKRPFDGPGLTAICASVAADSPPPLCSLAPAVPAPLEAVVMRCLEKDPSRRAQSVAEVAVALAPFAPSRSWPSIDRVSRRLPGGAPPGGVSMPPSLQRPSLPSISSSQPISAPIGPALTGPALAGPALVSAPAPEPPRAAEVPDATTVHMGAWGTTGPLEKKRPVALLAAGVVVVVIGLGALGWWALGPIDKRAAPPAAAAAGTSSAPAVTSATAAAPAAVPAAADTAPPSPAVPPSSTAPRDIVSPEAPPPAPAVTQAGPRPSAASPPKSPRAPAAKPRSNPLDRSD